MNMTSMRAKSLVLPPSATMVSVSSSARSRMPWAILRRYAPRSTAGKRSHAVCASLAAATARSTSAFPPLGSRAMISSVAGFNTSRHVPLKSVSKRPLIYIDSCFIKPSPVVVVGCSFSLCLNCLAYKRIWHGLMIGVWKFLEKGDGWRVGFD